MKKFILFLGLTVLLVSQVSAQTNFRSITYDEALAAAKDENKLVFIDFYTDWCGPCKMMARDVFPQKSVGDYMNGKFVCIKLNAEKEGKELTALFQVKAYPTFIVTDVNKKVLMKKEGGAAPDKFIAAIEREIDPEKSPERLKERYEGGERTAELIEAYADWRMSEIRDRDAAQKEVGGIISDYFNGLSDEQKLSPANLFIYTGYVDSPADPIVKYMVAHRNEFAPEIKNTIQECITKIYRQEVFNYLCAVVPYTDDEYQAVKKTINELGMNDTHYYDPVFELLDCHSKGDLNAFLTLCEEKYDSLDADQRLYLMAGLSRSVDTTDKTIRRRAAKFIRGKLPEMEVRLLFFIASVLSELERE